MSRITRREFLDRAVVSSGGLLAAYFLAACSAQPQTPVPTIAPTASPFPTSTAKPLLPTATPSPTSTPILHSLNIQLLRVYNEPNHFLRQTASGYEETSITVPFADLLITSHGLSINNGVSNPIRLTLARATPNPSNGFYAMDPPKETSIALEIFLNGFYNSVLRPSDTFPSDIALGYALLASLGYNPYLFTVSSKELIGPDGLTNCAIGLYYPKTEDLSGSSDLSITLNSCCFGDDKKPPLLHASQVLRDHPILGKYIGPTTKQESQL